MTKRAWMGGLAALSLLGGAPTLAQIHNTHQNAATPMVGASAPTAVSSPAPTPAVSHAQAAKARYADCMKRYKDRRGCRYLAWRRLS